MLTIRKAEGRTGASAMYQTSSKINGVSPHTKSIHTP
jgi:hypothetical protein